MKSMVESRYGKRFNLTVGMVGDRLFFLERVRADSLCGKPSDTLAICARATLDLPVCEIKGDVHRAMILRNGRTDRDQFAASFKNWKAIERQAQQDEVEAQIKDEIITAYRGTLWFS